ncbi:MAG: bifunctional riboflavin kinase/FAD synthetase [Verrucomicrobiales bacterium]|nr:bifunctional riboflavin kinase/FAD synthetase [Verrucomicrobiales bacterium]
MKILTDIQSIGSLQGPLHLAIGVFDGVHKGHQTVIRRALDCQKTSGGEVVVVTFDPHPVTVLAPESAPRLLTSTHHKAILIAELLDVRHLLVVRFDRKFAAQTGDVFIRQLCEAAEIGSISVGSDFQFGKGRSGNVALLDSLSSELNFQLNATEIVEIDGVVASSTEIREAIEKGDFASARKLLGREYTVLGTVIEGRQLGRTIGFPTANLTVHSEQLPPVGVYAVRASLNGVIHAGVANLGYRPTVEGADARLLLEVHLFDWEKDIYGEDLEIEFVRFIRGEQKFDGVEALKVQIQADAEEARTFLGV